MAPIIALDAPLSQWRGQSQSSWAKNHLRGTFDRSNGYTVGAYGAARWMRVESDPIR